MPVDQLMTVRRAFCPASTSVALLCASAAGLTSRIWVTSVTLTTPTLSAASFLYSCTHAYFDSFLAGEQSSLKYCSYFVSLSYPLTTDSSFNYRWTYFPALILTSPFFDFYFNVLSSSFSVPVYY